MGPSQTGGKAVACRFSERWVAATDEFKGIRQSAGWDAAILTQPSAPAPAGPLADPAFRAGLRRLGRLGRFGLSYESSLYHPQLPELADLARALPNLPILANHCGGPIRIDACSRVIFPVDKGMCSYPVVWNAFKRLAAGCSADEKAALFHGTAARFYRLTLPG